MVLPRSFLFGAAIEELLVGDNLVERERGEQRGDARALLVRDSLERAFHLGRGGEDDPLRLLRTEHVLSQILLVHRDHLSPSRVFIKVIKKCTMPAAIYLRHAGDMPF